MGIEPTFTSLQQDSRHNFNLPRSSLPMSAIHSNIILGLDFTISQIPDSRFEPGTAGWESRALPLCHTRLNIIQTFFGLLTGRRICRSSSYVPSRWLMAPGRNLLLEEGVFDCRTEAQVVRQGLGEQRVGQEDR